jgi:hypothetical protein
MSDISAQLRAQLPSLTFRSEHPDIRIFSVHAPALGYFAHVATAKPPYRVVCEGVHDELDSLDDVISKLTDHVARLAADRFSGLESLLLTFDRLRIFVDGLPWSTLRLRAMLPPCLPASIAEVVEDVVLDRSYPSGEITLREIDKIIGEVVGASLFYQSDPSFTLSHIERQMPQHYDLIVDQMRSLAFNERC